MSRSRKIFPRVGCKCPVMRLKMVDFPAPLGPMIQAICPWATVIDVLHRHKSIEGFGDFFNAEEHGVTSYRAPGAMSRAARWG